MSNMAYPREPIQHQPSADPNQLRKLVAEARSLCQAFAKAQVETEENSVLPFVQNELLVALEKQGPQTVPQLARAFSTSRQNVQTLVNRMTKTGLLSLARNPDHRKSSLVQMTDKGHRLLTAARKLENRLLRGIVPQSSKREVLGAIDLLRSLREQLLLRYGVHALPGQFHVPGTEVSRAQDIASHAEIPPDSYAVPKELEAIELPFNLL
jgi:DNA-binding MarR family transcriptional regulator